MDGVETLPCQETGKREESTLYYRALGQGSQVWTEWSREVAQGNKGLGFDGTAASDVFPGADNPL